MTLTRPLLLTALAGGLIRAPFHAPLQTSPSCWQAPEALTTPMLDMVRARVSATGAQADQFRSAVGLLQDSADSVYLITDDAVCHRAAAALSVFKGDSDTLNLSPVLVVKAGRARYVVDDGSSKGGEFSASYVADTLFSILGGLVH